MGGAKCSYRNCTIRSNGVTHMFHYPVFDKIRCHQWLTNSQRQDFLNLKVSQLKNRVICQHHFKPDNFMNYKMDKLKFDAVPTENGPYCNAEDFQCEYDVKIMPITPEDIENDKLTSADKQKTFSVKYGDFLTNSEVIVLDQKPEFEFQIPKVDTKKKITELPSQPPKKKIHIISEKKMSAPVSLKGSVLKPVPPNSIIKPFPKKTFDVENVEVLSRRPKGLEKAGTPLTSSDILFNNPQTLVDPQNVLVEQSSITLPPIAPIIPPAPTAEPNKVLAPNQISNQQSKEDKSKSMYMATLDSGNVLNETTTIKSKKDESTKIVTQTQSPNKTLLKSKIPPERVAAIEEKRQFNKKLRDMIEFCLDDSPKKIIETEKRDIVPNPVKTAEVETRKPILDRRASLQVDKQAKSDKVSSLLSKDSSLPSLNDYNMASLEARLKKMEDNLLSKITQNSKNILEIKSVISPPITKYTVATQTKEDPEVTKKQLFEEISKFLCPETNSILYEELFLASYGTAANPRKRKLRQAK
ncbi:THAP domain-containing protein [Phthorimaea operculella]|nr:THAP domain-containing protein [Phthorimaea operculella]